MLFVAAVDDNLLFWAIKETWQVWLCSSLLPCVNTQHRFNCYWYTFILLGDFTCLSQFECVPEEWRFIFPLVNSVKSVHFIKPGQFSSINSKDYLKRIEAVFVFNYKVCLKHYLRRESVLFDCPDRLLLTQKARLFINAPITPYDNIVLSLYVRNQGSTQNAVLMKS